jgi:hypothetical protein
MPNTNHRRNREDHMRSPNTTILASVMENANGYLTVDGSQFITVGSGHVNFTSSRIPAELLHAGQFFLYGVPLAPARLRLRRPS